MVDVYDLNSLLAWLATAGSPYLVGIALSYLVENWAGWHKLPRQVKALLPLLASVALAALATWLQTSQAIVLAIQPYYTFVVGAVMAYIGSQQAYMSAKKHGYGVKA
jgi:hypothetical protein